jgi:nucleoside-diphosphate-sugar epimerase
MRLPDHFEDEALLDEFLSVPWPETVALMQRLDGDVMILGAGGKVGPTLARLARCAVSASGAPRRVIAAGRFSRTGTRQMLEETGVETFTGDFLDSEFLSRLPRVKNILYLVGRKFGLVGSEAMTWMINAVVPDHVCRAFPESRIVAFSTGCVYPLVPPESGGCTEATAPAPVGEYAHSCLARERIFEHHSNISGTPVLHFRLNYALELRYGVLVDIALKIKAGQPIDRAVGAFNFIWQGDAANIALLCLEHCDSPPAILNVSGPAIHRLEDVAAQLGRQMNRTVELSGEDLGRAYLTDTGSCSALFGPPRVPADQVIKWVADWISHNRPTLGKATHFQVTDGQFLDQP